MTHALRKRGWLIGFGLMLCMFVLQASALRFGQLSVVQPVLTGELIFLVIILVTAFHRSVGWRELVGIAAIVAGLAGFFAAASPAPRHGAAHRPGVAGGFAGERGVRTGARRGEPDRSPLVAGCCARRRLSRPVRVQRRPD